MQPPLHAGRALPTHEVGNGTGTAMTKVQMNTSHLVRAITICHKRPCIAEVDGSFRAKAISRGRPPDIGEWSPRPDSPEWRPGSARCWRRTRKESPCCSWCQWCKFELKNCQGNKGPVSRRGGVTHIRPSGHLQRPVNTLILAIIWWMGGRSKAQFSPTCRKNSPPAVAHKIVVTVQHNRLREAMVSKYVVIEMLGNFRRLIALRLGVKCTSWMSGLTTISTLSCPRGIVSDFTVKSMKTFPTASLEWGMARGDRRAVGCPVRRPHKRCMSRYTSSPMAPSRGSKVEPNSPECAGNALMSRHWRVVKVLHNCQSN